VAVYGVFLLCDVDVYGAFTSRRGPWVAVHSVVSFWR